MFDRFSQELIPSFPDFDGLLSSDVSRALSMAYFSVVRLRLEAATSDDSELQETRAFLRRLVNSVFFQVILNERRERNDRKAAAFVAGEGCALLAELAHANEDTDPTDDRVARIESALLYLFAEYDACALGVLSQRVEVRRVVDDQEASTRASLWAFERIEKLCQLDLRETADRALEVEFFQASDLTPHDLDLDTSARVYAQLGIAADEFREWLSGNTSALDAAVARLDRLISTLSSASSNTAGLSDSLRRARHLGILLKLCIPDLRGRALMHSVPTPPTADPVLFRRYLTTRAVGSSGQSGRPVLWPSARDFIQKCVGSDRMNAVVAMPTGSGKSFVAELAISQAAHEGWVLYLAPTNALTQQIREDLRFGLAELDTEVFAFVGDHEYSVFTDERVGQMPRNSVAVMTPEKCGLALRLNPEVFTDCRLIVFDECHLIGDNGSLRGAVSEIVVSQLMLRAPGATFLLMSAIVQNPGDLASWLREATGKESATLALTWRPTRTLRGILCLDKDTVEAAGKNAVKWLQRSEKRKSRSFDSHTAIAVGLQGAWQSEDVRDYALSSIDCAPRLKALKDVSQGTPRFMLDSSSWVNSCSVSLAQFLVERGIQTLLFNPASRHYPFSNSRKINLPDSAAISHEQRPPLVQHCRTLAEFELGCASEVFLSLDRGVAIHTSAMLETEKIASEVMFKAKCAPLMIATGTLAQGLNLPAVAVVIGGSRIGDQRGQDREVVKRRRLSQLLNAAGRAGRAGFANQGIVIAVPDDPIVVSGVSGVASSRSRVDYLQHSDDAVDVNSGLRTFVDSVAAGSLQAQMASDLELHVLSLVVGGDERQVEPIELLRKSYAAHQRRQSGLPEVTDEAAERMVQIGRDFINETQAPPWLTVAAQRSGLDFFLTLAITRAWGTVRSQYPAGYEDWPVSTWRDEFLAIVRRIAPQLLARHLVIEGLQHASHEFRPVFKKQEQYLYERALDWEPPEVWTNAWSSASVSLDQWMRGDDLKSIAAQARGIATEEVPPDRIQGKPLPGTVTLTQGTWSQLSLVAGGFLAVAEAHWSGNVPRGLACLPLCIKYGLNSRERLAWYRYGIRLRKPAIELADRFPPPSTANDDELRVWVREAKRRWLRQGESPNHHEGEVLKAIRGFLLNHRQ